MTKRSGSGTLGLLVGLAADAVVAILVLYIILYVLGANADNEFVSGLHDAASWLASWAKDLFTPNDDDLRVLVNFGIPAVVYLVFGNALGRTVSRL